MGQTTFRAILGIQPAEWGNPLSVAEAVAKAEALDPAELMIFAAASMQVDPALGGRLLEAERELSEGRLREAQTKLAEILRGAPADRLHEAFTLAQTRFGETAQVVGQIRQVLKRRAATAAESISETDAIQIAKEVSDLVEQEYMGLLRYCLENPEVKLDTDFGRHLSALHQTLSASMEAAKESLSGHLENPPIKEKIEQMESIADLLSFGASEIIRGEANPVFLLSALFPGLDERTHLTETVLYAILQNLDKAREKGIQIFLDIPKGIRLPDENTAIHLGESVRELIKNAIKYSDPDKPKRWVQIFWRPLGKPLMVADNGLGIKDTSSVWREGVRERAEVADGLGIGLGTAGGRLDEVGWGISVESTVGRGTTFALWPNVPDTLRYEDDYDPSLYRLQQIYYQREGRFDLATLTPSVVAQMNPAELAPFFLKFLREHPSKLSEARESDQWVLRFPLESSPNFASLFSSWPPDPKGDIILRTYLEVLGWTMTVEETSEHIVVRIDFGQNTIT